MQVVLTFDDRELQEFMKAWEEPAVARTLGAAASAYGRTVKPILQAATPIARPGNPYADSAGNLQRLTKSKRISKRRGIGVVIGPMGRNAFYRGMVTGGTKPHLILPKSQGGKLKIAAGYVTAIHHPGSRPNPYVSRIGALTEVLGTAAAERVIFAGLEGQRVNEGISDT